MTESIPDLEQRQSVYGLLKERGAAAPGGEGWLLVRGGRVHAVARLLSVVAEAISVP